MASALAGKPAAFVNADVALGGDTVVGSFTVDGLTFAVTGESSVELVGIAPSVIPSEAAGVEGFDSDQASEAGVTNLTLPETVTYESADYTVTSIGAYAFYLSGLTSITLPASVSDVDDRAFRSSDVASVTLADENSSFSSYDGALYDATRSSLLLIPGGRQGAVRISDKAEEVDASAFSHCAGVDSISVDAGSAHLSSWEGLLYDADGTTLLRVPAGATEITIRDGCTTIAAGALEACASLTTINAPASVTSISPYLLEQEPETVMAPIAVAAVEGKNERGSTKEGESADATPQLTAMVALSTTDDDLPTVDPAVIAVSLPADVDPAPWLAVGFAVGSPQSEPEDGTGGGAGLLGASLESASSYAATAQTVYRRFDQSTVYFTSANASSWTKSAAKINKFITNSTKYDAYRFYNGWLYLRNPSNSTPTVYAQSNTGGRFSGLRVATSETGPFTEVPESANYTVITRTTYLWVITGYALTFNDEGGSGGPGTVSIANVGEPNPTKVATPSLSGWTFSGYTDDFSSMPILYYGSNGAATWQAASITADKTLHANWTKTVTFNANGGTQGSLKTLTALKGYPLGRTVNQVDSSNANYPIRSLFVNPIKVNSSWAPTRTGYTFAGFYDTSASSGGTQYIDASGNLKVPTCPSNMPATLYARWTPLKYTISYTLNGGSVSGNPTSYTPDTAAFTLKNPTRTGYTFTGWSGTGLTGSANKTVTIAKGSIGNRAYTANWTPNITLTWNSQGGSAVASTTQAYSASTKVKLPSNPTRTGYTFKGWFTAASGGTQVTANTALPSSNTTYHAQWTANSYTVEYWNKAGTVKLSSDTGFKYDTARNLAGKPSSGVNAGYTAVGWATAANQTKATYGFGSSQKNLVASGTKKLFLAETANTIRTTWHYNGGTIDGNAGSTYRDTVYASGKRLGDALDPDFWAEGRLARAGYHFAGWFTAASGGTQVSADTALPTSNATYYAHWVEQGPQVRFLAGSDIWRNIDRSLGGPEGIGSFASPYGGMTYTARLVFASGRVDAIGVSSYEPVREVTYHIGLNQSVSGVTSAWLVTGDAQGNKAGSWLSSSGASVAGKASADVYLNGYGASTITWDAQGGECSTTATPNIMPYDTAVSPEPKRAGFVFEGWYDGTGEDAKLACKAGQRTPQITADTTYYARWAPAIRADAPISATVRLDILGVEDQAMDEEEPGYLESRCGEPLKVAEVAFEKKPGATDLFGAHVTDIELQALPGKDASWATGSPAFSFALDATGEAATEDDAAKLAPLSMSGYEVRIPISYRFLIPDALLDEVLGAIDPATFEDKKTPVCSVTYTMALANPES